MDSSLFHFCPEPWILEISYQLPMTALPAWSHKILHEGI